MTNDFVKKGYNQAAEDYNITRNQSENNTYLEKLISLLPQNATVLDIGCGAGKPVDSYLISKGYNVIGLDISEKMIELAKRNVPDAEYKVEDMAELEKGEYTVDAVVSFYAIFHTPRESHQELLAKINSFLPQGGFMLITMGADEWEGTEENFHGSKMYWSHYGSEKNKHLVEEAGFTIIVNKIDSGKERHQIILAKKK